VAPVCCGAAADATARLHGDRGNPVIDQRHSGDGLGLREGSLDRLGIAHTKGECDIAGDLVMDERGARTHRILGLHHGGKHLIIDGDPLGRIARQRLGRGEHHGDAVANVAYAVKRERRPLRAMAFRTAHILGHEFGVEGAEPVSGPIVPCQYGIASGDPCRGSDVDAADVGVGVRRVKEYGVRLPGEFDVGDIAGPPCQKTGVLLARDRLSDAELHGVCPLFPEPVSCRNLRSFDREEKAGRAYAHVQNEHVWQMAWAEIMTGGVAPQAAAEKAFKRVEEIFAKYPI
jgi:hypothetical protein